MIDMKWRRLAPAAMALWLCGCGSYPLPKVYVLGEPPTPAAGVSSEAGLPVVELRTVTTPDDVDTTDILRRTGPNLVTASPTGRWSERVSVGLTQALAADLSRRLPGVVLATRSAYEPTRRLLVDVKEFEIAPDGRCVLSARWGMTPAGGKSQTWSDQGTFIVAASSRSDAAAAAAMTLATDQLADQIAVTVRHTLDASAN